MQINSNLRSKKLKLSSRQFKISKPSWKLKRKGWRSWPGCMMRKKSARSKRGLSSRESLQRNKIQRKVKTRHETTMTDLRRKKMMVRLHMMIEQMMMRMTRRLRTIEGEIEGMISTRKRKKVR